MSDKSFGDYINRNVVKNPLLSTAVVGLSIEDLTQNAVLLPAVPSQELVKTQDEQNESQMRSLWHSDHNVTALSGDTHSITPQQQSTPMKSIHTINNNKNTQNEKNNDMHTISKASVKTTDDFDVNEYFARLQGTRYVSAPLNSNVTEQNANLQAEENLEEINLNDSVEPVGSENVQQSITADIAQNFSQLPNVLPHVASAVFSSFSNMLSLKSREVTPDEPKHDARKADAVNASTVPEPPVAVAPPPLKEPPTTGTTSNYRITTRKKVYAQVPGLSSGDNQNIQTFKPGPSTQNTPSFFIPDPNIANVAYDGSNIGATTTYDMQTPVTDNIKTENIYKTIAIDNVDKGSYEPTQITMEKTEDNNNKTNITATVPLVSDQTGFNATANQTNTTTYIPTQIVAETANDNINVHNPVIAQSGANLNIQFTQYNFDTGHAAERQPGLFTKNNANNAITFEEHNFPSPISSFNPIPDSRFEPLPPQTTGVIPPPPMFSNIPRSDGPTTVGKSVLPPSVARRISANHPIIKPQALPSMAPHGNIFIPSAPFEPEPQQLASSYNSPNPHLQPANIEHFSSDKLESITQTNLQTQTLPPANNPESSMQIPLHSSTPSHDLLISNSSVHVKSTLPETSTSIPHVPKELSSIPTVNPFFDKEAGKMITGPPKTIQPTSRPITDSNNVMKAKEANTIMFGQYSNETSLQTTVSQQITGEHTSIAPPMFINPSTLNIPTTQKAKEDIQKYQDAATQDKLTQSMINAPSELLKETLEPPKISGNLSYRLTKKKPQYYSGPIEGVGNISNNIKPVLNPIGYTSFQGAIFTPGQIVESTNQNIATTALTDAPENAIPFDLTVPTAGSSFYPGDIFTPDQSVPPLTQDYSLPSTFEPPTSFDLNKSTATVYPTFGANERAEQKPLMYSEFNTVFDLSRQTTESYEETPQESKSFGIIGSLKSKLSSIDINKIQNTVTTFFDPAYNDTKVEEKKHDNLSYYDNTLSVGSYQNFSSPESAHLEVYHDPNIPSVIQQQVNPNLNSYQTDSSQFMIQQQYQTQDYFNQAQNYHNTNYPQWDGMYQQTPSNTVNLLAHSANKFEDINKSETVTSKGMEEYLNTPLLSSDTTIKTDAEQPPRDDEYEKVVNVSPLTECIPLNTSGNLEQVLKTGQEICTDKIDIPTSSSVEIFEQSEMSSDPSSFFSYSKEEPHSLLETNSSKDKELAHNIKVFSDISAENFFDRHQPQEYFITNKLPEKERGIQPYTGFGEILHKSTLNYNISSNLGYDYQFPTHSNDNISSSGLQSLFGTPSTADSNTKEILTTVVLPVLQNLSDDLVPPEYLDDSVKDQSPSSLKDKITDDNKETDKVSHHAYTLFNFGQSDNASAPYENIKNIEEKLGKVDINDDSQNLLNQISTTNLFEKSVPITEDSQQVSELSICETCREFNKPEDKDSEDLTMQLVENITAPIQLANPVEYSLASSFTADKPEISHITEDIIETMKLPSPVPLIDDISVNSNINYGWSTNETQCLTLHGHDYGFSPDPLSMGFFQDKTSIFENIPTNASDEIKAEYRISQEDTLLIYPPLNIPTAPPEEDTKSDESGLDVHSIEQDAKKDFPLYEEFTIEPSETDDDKIEYKERERSSDDPIPDADTFTNRVERYKKMETNPEPEFFDLKKDLPFELPTSTSPALTIASYFDTGNYAVENHYRNTLNSPSTVTYSVNCTPMRIPPGFEEEYKRRLSIAGGLPVFSNQNINPSTITLPNVTYLTDSSDSKRAPYTEIPSVLMVADVKNLVKKIIEDSSVTITERLPAFSNIVEQNIEEKQDKHVDKLAIEKEPPKPIQPKVEPIADPNSFFSSNLDSIDNTDSYTYSRLSRNIDKSAIKDEPQKHMQPQVELLPDPNSFFSTNVDCIENSDARNFSRQSRNIDKPAIEKERQKPIQPTIEPITDPNSFFSSNVDSIENLDAYNFSTLSRNIDKSAIEKEPPKPIQPKVEPITDPNSFFSSNVDSIDNADAYNYSGLSRNIDKPAIKDEPHKPIQPKVESLPDPNSFFSTNIESTESSDAFNHNRLEPQKPVQPKVESLPDANSFFSSNVESTDSSDAYNYSRLSSYFNSPPKPDHSKSFFELSQSQDHYRHKPKTDAYDSIQQNVKSFFDTQTNVPNDEASNIPENANISLIRDLTSFKNFTPDEVDKTVNYFNIVHKIINSEEVNIGEPKSANLDKIERLETDKKDKDLKNNQLGDVSDDLKFEDIVKNCKYCCGMTKNFSKVDFDSLKVRKGMDNKCDTNKEGCSLNEKKDGGGKRGMTVNFVDQTFDDNSDRIVSMSENRSSPDYSPVKHHWFYRVDYEDKSIWRGFSFGDSKALEDAYNSPDLNENTVVATDGGRFDVNVMGRIRTAVYWTDKPTNVMRCSWFYKGTAVPRYIPYTETVAEKLEEMYRSSVSSGEWHRRLMLPNEEMVVMHGPSVMVHFLQTADAFTSTPSMRQRVVRGCVESEIEDTEPSSIDHLLLMCHGVGSACDMRFRSVEEVVDDFRSTSLQLVQAHYKNSYDNGLVGRVEVLPISWHSSLHSGETGVDTRLAAVTLESIPRLRNFTNDTLLDVLFYTSPVFCQTIIDTVCSELNRIYALFKQRNPGFEGGVSLGGHSLGSVILYDLLSHQVPQDAGKPVSTDKTYVTGTAGTGQPCVKYPRLDFDPDTLYALGSPIAIFECIRGVHTLGLDFCLPTCKNFFNIFHPYDPIAYRLEPMVNPVLRDVKPFLIPHHKGRKRMHLELKDTMARVGADIKQKLLESIKSTWSSMWKTQPPPDTHLEKVVEEEMEKEQLNAECSKEDQIQENEVTPDMLGRLNGGRRIDHVLQEAPFEMINEYLFAMSSHVCYWRITSLCHRQTPRRPAAVLRD
ncbi:uncharacterized protein LOC112049543 isoform X2 [Bicyclus anynana]|uniref:Uncharacterized protein LOC112049543 isoform X2 n=1 Tax=Bicyclus anynana TaxID=110368 RepID=A0ABM3M4G4_BICAN|nr:uncharacterized protein LOC112049543 isoform X2 [Bicyclus anynana]